LQPAASNASAQTSAMTRIRFTLIPPQPEVPALVGPYMAQVTMSSLNGFFSLTDGSIPM
jgi:hypothetical protein